MFRNFGGLAHVIILVRKQCFEFVALHHFSRYESIVIEEDIIISDDDGEPGEITLVERR